MKRALAIAGALFENRIKHIYAIYSLCSCDIFAFANTI